MKRYGCRLALLVVLVVSCQISLQGSAQAAPGDFLFKWGLPYLLARPSSAAIDSNGNTYVTEAERIRVLDRSGNLVRTFGSFGSGDGQVMYPSDIAVYGNLVYVADNDNFRIEVFDTNGNFVRKWGSEGTGNGYFMSPDQIAIDGRGYVYVADAARIQVFDGNGNFIRAFGSYGSGDGQFGSLGDVAVDSAGNIYTVESLRVQVFDNLGHFLRKWSLDPSEPYFGLRIALDGLGNVFVGEINPNEIPIFRVVVFDTSGTILAHWPLFLFGFGPHQLMDIGDLTIDSSRNVYIADWQNDRVQVFDSNGGYVRTLGGTTANGQFRDPNGIATDTAGNVYVADAGNARIQVFDSSGNFLRKFGSRGFDDGQFASPYNVTVDRSGNIYVVDLGSSGYVSHRETKIQVFDRNGNYLRSWEWPVAEESYPWGIAVDTSGNVYVSDTHYHVNVYSNDGTLLRSWGTLGSGPADLGLLGSLALDSFGNVYVANRDHKTIQVFTGTGTFLRSWGSEGTGDGQFLDPTWIAIDGAGNVYVTDIDAYGGGANSRIQVFDTNGRFLGKFGSYGTGNGQFTRIAGVAASPSGGTVYVADTSANTVQAFVGFGDQLPAGWIGRDVGSVGVKGSAAYANGTFTLKGSGDNIYGTVDGFHYVYKPLTGDGQIVARVASVQNTNGYAKGGVMIRQTLAANSAHAMMSVTPSYGAQFSRRLTTGGSTSVTTTSGVAAPYWVKLVRQGNSFSGYVSRDGITWSLVGTSTITMGSSVYVGLIANSRNNSVLCTTAIDSVSLSGQTNTPTVQITAPASGASFAAPGPITISATATPSIGATVEKVQFFAGSTLVGTASASPYTVSWSNVTAGSYSLSAVVTDSTGATTTSTPVAITVTGGGLPAPWLTRDIGSVGVAGSAGAANGLFTVKGSGADIYGTADGFRYVYQQVSGNVQIVARVASVQNTNTYAKGGVMIRQSLASNSIHAMMDVTAAGGAQFARRTATGGTTYVTTRTGISAPYWVKLVRNGTTLTGWVSSDGANWSQVGSSTVSMTTSVYVGLAVTSHNNSTLCTSTFDSVTVAAPDTTAPTVTAFTIPATSASLTVPITTFTATDTVGVKGYLVNESSTRPSATASGWSATAPTSYTFTSAGTKTLYAWAKDAAGNVSASRSATVTITTGGLPSPWLTQDIGSVGVAGSAGYVNGVFTLKGSGSDIYNTADSFRFVYKTMTGDGQIIARVATLQNTGTWAKTGVMMRQSLASNSMHAMMEITPANGAQFLRRTSTGGSSSTTTRTGIAAPYWVRLVRSGNTFTGYVSSNGTTWTQVGSSTIGMSTSIYVGLAVSSNNNTVLCTSTMDHVQ